jgi:hypothetical protein
MLSLRVVQGAEGDAMGWLDKWFGDQKPAPVAAQAPGGQAAMTLDERMAFRRQMVLESVRDVMVNHGLLSPGYRASVARLDTRGHQFAVMVDMLPAAAGRTVDSPGELHAMEARITLNALRRYKIKVTGVYWRVVQEITQPVVVKTEVAPTTAAAAPVAPQPVPKPVFLRRKTDHPEEDGFPDTLVEARPADDDSVSADELAAFERALSEGQSPQSVSLGRRTYETDFAPLV